MKRTILITGATGKFGRVLTRYFLDAGDSVIAVGRSIENLFGLRDLSPISEDKLHLLELDLTEENSSTRLVERLVDLGIQPDSLINNARNIETLKLDHEGRVTSDNFLAEFKLGVIVPYELTMELTNFRENPFKAVVNVGSIYGSVVPNLSLYTNPVQQSPIHYGVSKAALVHLTKELAVRLANKNIRVNCVSFGGVEGRVDDAFKKRYAKLCPSGRMLSENEIAGPIDMLLSDAASGITGHTLMVDGGWSIW